MITAGQIIKKLDMKPLPEEGGFYREIYRSDISIESDEVLKRYGSKRSVGTQIYYLLTKNQKSVWHQVKSDELWHFYLGGKIKIWNLLPNGDYKNYILGNDILSEDNLQVLIPKDTIQGAYVIEGDFVLCGTTVFPGFEFQDFEKPDLKEMLKKYNSIQSVIRKLI